MRSPHKIPRRTHDEFVFGVLGELSPTLSSVISKSLQTSLYTNPISDYSKSSDYTKLTLKFIKTKKKFKLKFLELLKKFGTAQK